MSNARKILDERLAKGEITIQEHQDLILKISSGTDDTEHPVSSPPQIDAAKAANTLGKNKGWIIAGVIVVLVLIGIGNLKKNKTQILNLRSSGFFGDIVSGTLITEGKSGKIYLWVEQNGKMMCPRTTYIRSNIPQRFEFSCSSLATSGRFKVRTNRIPKDWVKDNATSL